MYAKDGYQKQTHRRRVHINRVNEMCKNFFIPFRLVVRLTCSACCTKVEVLFSFHSEQPRASPAVFIHRCTSVG